MKVECKEMTPSIGTDYRLYTMASPLHFLFSWIITKPDLFYLPLPTEGEPGRGTSNLYLYTIEHVTNSHCNVIRNPTIFIKPYSYSSSAIMLSLLFAPVLSQLYIDYYLNVNNVFTINKCFKMVKISLCEKVP